MLRDDLINDLLDLALRGDVKSAGQSTPALGADGAADVLSQITTDIGGNHNCPGGGESAASGLSKTTSATGDECDLSFQ